MEKVIVKIGDTVKLYNGTEGIISEIDKSTSRFLLSEPYIIWFHLRNVQYVNGKEIDNDYLSF